ncbi:hypothetical protein CLIB1444_09S04676 [[Candida] jaroonii]|uniref:Uncharacterized protein n=1 Tax=[Candida] jaroonii TaxID=467808 RepID=A0ACA9YBQ1_9ASCO|nr:hypothetical protein CLIB1444_09S04676 [[Candida] jaroonii]
MTIEILQSDNKESPISKQLVEDIVRPIIAGSTDNLEEQLINELTNKFQTVSTRHKFLIQLTKIEGNDLKIDNKFGAIWEDKDGYMVVKIKEEEFHLMINIFWLFVS